jgi:hypothetical protein
MRIESTVTTVSWIPSEAVTGLTRLPFEIGAMRYDDPPPDHIDDLESLRADGRFRFANRLAAWIEVEDGHITGHGYCGGGTMGSTTVRLGASATFAAIGLPDLQHDPVVESDRVRFVQTTGGRPAIPAPRHVNHPPFVQIKGPIVWTTLELAIHADGTSTFDLVGASPFPRHWVYGNDGNLAAKAGLADFKDWYRHAFGPHTPWGDEDSPAITTAVESQLERDLSTTIMRGGAKPEIRRVRKNHTLVEQGEPGRDVYLLLNGVLRVEVDGEPLAELGPGAILGERAILEGGRRTATLRAATSCKVAVVPGDRLDVDALDEVSEGHRREDR